MPLVAATVSTVSGVFVPCPPGSSRPSVWSGMEWSGARVRPGRTRQDSAPRKRYPPARAAVTAAVAAASLSLPLSGAAADCQVLEKSASGDSNMLPPVRSSKRLDPTLPTLPLPGSPLESVSPFLREANQSWMLGIGMDKKEECVNKPREVGRTEVVPLPQKREKLEQGAGCAYGSEEAGGRVPPGEQGLAEASGARGASVFRETVVGRWRTRGGFFLSTLIPRSAPQSWKAEGKGGHGVGRVGLGQGGASEPH